MSEPPKAKGKEIESEKGYALFDLDQTLIPWDTQLLFCNWILRRYPARRILMLVFMLFLPLFKILGAGGMKRVFIIYLVGFKEDELDQEVKAFVEWLLDRYTYPEIVQRLEQEKQDGKRTILTSASPEFYVIEIGKQLGFDYAYGTRFSWKDSVPLFPDLDRENNKGTEKVRRMRAEGSIPPDDGLSYSVAYSDSKADSSQSTD